MVKNFDEEFEDEPEEEEEAEVEEEEPPKKIVKGVVKTYAKESDYKKAKEEEKKEEIEVKDRYVPYHVPERFGIMDTKTQKPISEATEVMGLILDSQIKVLQKLQEVLEAVG